MPPIIDEDTFQEPQLVPEDTISTEPHICYVFSYTCWQAVHIEWHAGQSVSQARHSGQREISAFRSTTQDSPEFKTYELFISGIFHLMFLECNWPWVAEGQQRVKLRIRGLLYFLNSNPLLCGCQCAKHFTYVISLPKQIYEDLLPEVTHAEPGALEA